MKAKDKLNYLRTQVGHALDILLKDVKHPLPPQQIVKVGEALTEGMNKTLPSSAKSPEEKARDRAEKRFQKKQDRLIEWLKSDGIKAGAMIIRLADGAIVEALTDPRLGLQGPTIDVKLPDGTQDAVNPLEYRPDFSVVAQAALAKAKTAQVPKVKKAKKAKAS